MEFKLEASDQESHLPVHIEHWSCAVGRLESDEIRRCGGLRFDREPLGIDQPRGAEIWIRCKRRERSRSCSDV
jgi:hypothetical protein